MGEDWLLDAIDEVRHAAASVRDLMADTALLDRVTEERRSGASTTDVLTWFAEPGRRRRLQAAEAIARYEHAVMMFRARLVRTLVDDEGMRISDVARRMAVSRQMCSRLYQAAVDGDRSLGT